MKRWAWAVSLLMGAAGVVAEGCAVDIPDLRTVDGPLDASADGIDGRDDPPSALTADEIGVTSVTLSWIDNSSTETAFELERWNEATTSWPVVGVTGPDTTSMTDTSLSPSTKYGYRVYATTPSWRKGPSNEVWVTTEGP